LSTIFGESQIEHTIFEHFVFLRLDLWHHSSSRRKHLSFSYDRDAISVRLGKRIDRAVIARQPPNGEYQQDNTHWRSQWRCICIEEPFTYLNTAHSMHDEMVFDAIKTAFREAHEELNATRDLQCLLNCKPISVNAPMGGCVE
uniref:PAP-associated domain-containing protein n=1 Tax=Angiostrongylus cantonensis TaxID=6313 RepID=A0A0K0D840_ANGCA